MTSAPVAASRASWVTVRRPPALRTVCCTRASGSYPGGVATTSVVPKSAPSRISEWHTLLPSPTQARRIAPRSMPRSQSVKKSASAWHGCSKSLSALITGTVAWRARPSTVSCKYTRAAIPSTQSERLRAASGTDSRVPSPISGPERCTARPPNWTTPTSNVTRVLSDGFSKINASVRPLSGAPRRPAFQPCLSAAATSNRCCARSRLRSAAERKWLTGRARGRAWPGRGRSHAPRRSAAAPSGRPSRPRSG